MRLKIYLLGAALFLQSLLGVSKLSIQPRLLVVRLSLLKTALMAFLLN